MTTTDKSERDVMRVVTGTDERTLAQGLCHILIHTLTEAASDVSECLMTAETDADGFLAVASDAIDFVQNNIKILKEQIEDFESVCDEVRKDISKELDIAL